MNGTPSRLPSGRRTTAPANGSPAMQTLAVLLFLLVAGTSSVGAQAAPRIVPSAEITVGSEFEEYFRWLQTTGEVAPQPWSIRGFSPREVDRIAPDHDGHPWSVRYRFGEPPRPGQIAGIAPRVTTYYNSAFPYGPNSGPVWVGRGLTTAIQGGFTVRAGAASLAVAPVAFRAENQAFPLLETGLDGPLEYADGLRPGFIDLPQRFGSETYSRIDPGESSIRLDFPLVTVGVATGSQHWGPATEQPILLGNNAGGFAHAWLGTGAPADIWVGRVHGRMVWGRLEQSAYSPLDGPEGRRFMSGIIGVISPRGLPGLEVGLGRFFHSFWPETGPGASDFLKPIESFLKHRLPDFEVIPGDPKTDEDNQLASVFFRWVLPKDGFEVYGEFGREDHNWDLRDFLLQPDHDSSYMLGFRKAWRPHSSRIVALRGELLNAQVTHLARVRVQVPFYIHVPVRQGHTHRGQVLGAPAGYGGAAAVLALESLDRRGRWSVHWSREVRQEDPRTTGPGELEHSRLDVIHSVGAEVVRFAGPFDLTAGLWGMYNLNRNFGSDVTNLRAVLRVRANLH
jgi:hypothetical protein